MCALPASGLIGSAAASSGNAMGSGVTAGAVGSAVVTALKNHEGNPPTTVVPFSPPLVAPRSGDPVAIGVQFLERIVRHIQLPPQEATAGSSSSESGSGSSQPSVEAEEQAGAVATTPTVAPPCPESAENRETAAESREAGTAATEAPGHVTWYFPAPKPVATTPVPGAEPVTQVPQSAANQ